MGQRGPAPKRSTQRRRQNKESKPEIARVSGRVIPPKVDGKWHPAAKRWYKALGESGQAQFFEPSDWEAAHFLAGEISNYLRSDKRSAMMFSHIWSAMGELLTTEASRRRLKLEIERDDAKGSQGEVADLDAYRKRLAS
jgi:hypothetical protein